MQEHKVEEKTSESVVTTITRSFRGDNTDTMHQIEPSQEILELLSEIYKLKKNTAKLTTELKKAIAKHFFINGCHDMQEFNKRIEPYAACFVRMTIESDKEELPAHLKIKYKDKLDIYDQYVALKAQKQDTKKRIHYATDFEGTKFCAFLKH